jgi:predicted RNA-binding Zn-ribbon protein involved in translation (DUF1610 family)
MTPRKISSAAPSHQSMEDLMTVDKNTCPHTSGLAREYIAGMNTGDYACNDCGLAISPQMWAELRRQRAASVAVKQPSLPIMCPVCGDSLLTRHSDWRGLGRTDGYCMTCGYEVQQQWRSVT